MNATIETQKTSPYVYPLLSSVNSKSYQPDAILRLMLDHFGFELKDISIRTRKREVVVKRQTCFYFLKLKTRLSLAEIGKMFRCEDQVYNHATVIHGCRTISNLIETDKRFRNIIEEISIKISNMAIWKTE